jgi:hypothetical protein
MNADIVLLLANIAELFVVFFHGMGRPVAFAISVIVQSMWVVWGYQIKDWVFLAGGAALASLNGYFHVVKQKKNKGEAVESLYYSNSLMKDFKPKQLERKYIF